MRKLLVFSWILFGSMMGGAIAQMGVPYGGSVAYGAFAGLLQLTQSSINRTIVWIGSSGFSNSWIWQSDPNQGISPGSNPISGTCTDPSFCSPNFFVVGRDTVDASAAANGFYGYMFSDNFGGSGAKSSHHTGLSAFSYVATPSDTATPSYSTWNFWSLANAAAPASGGDMFGINIQCKMSSAATGWTQCIGDETDIDIDPAATVNQLIGKQVVQQNAGGSGGTQFNAAYSANSVVGAAGWDYLYVDGAYAGYPSLKSTGTWGGCFPHAGSGNCGTIANGIDFRLYTFTGTPFGAPLMTPATSAATCVAGGIEWDANFLYICTASNTWKRAALSTF